MTGIDFSRHHFLIVDDKQFLRNLIHGVLLQHHAGSIKHANHGAGAIKTLSDARGRVDCVLCDWNMEPINGLELLRMIRAGNVENAPRDLRFVMMTGYGDMPVVKAAMALDVSGYLVKPASAEQLVKAIAAAFAKPVPLKSRSVYESFAPVELPEGLNSECKRIPPWVLLSGMQQKARELMSDRLDQIRADSEKSAQDRKVKNAKMLPLEEIENGKVLAEHIYSEGGRLLLSMGTVLNGAMLRRLHEVMLVSHESIRLLVGDFEE
jgi:DNA-binding NarL/FixJ family response regulator